MMRKQRQNVSHCPSKRCTRVHNL